MMNIKLTKRIWDLQDEELKGSRLLLLLALAEHANKDGVCWPSVARLAQRTRVSKKTVQRDIKWLEEVGYIVISKKGNGRGNMTVYRITLKGDNMTPFMHTKGVICDTERVTSATLKGDIDTPSNGGQVLTKVQKERILSNRNGADAPVADKSLVAISEPSPPLQAKNRVDQPMASTGDEQVSPLQAKKGQKGEPSPADLICDAYVRAIEEHETDPVFDMRGLREWAKRIAQAGHSPDDVAYTVHTLKKKADGFWAGQHLSLAAVAKQIGAIKSQRNPRGSRLIDRIDWL